MSDIGTGEISQEFTWIAITGSSSGIGKTTALYLAQKGFGIVVCSEQPEANRDVCQEIISAGGRAEVVDLNLLNPDDVGNFFHRVNEKVGFCEVLINNAGIGLHKTHEETSDEEVRRVFEINFFALTSLCRQAIHYMKAQGRGHIINVSSASARRSIAQISCYGASKGAVHCFTQAIRPEVAPYGISVTEILPISVKTEFFDRAGYQPKGLVQTPETIARLIERALRTKEAELCSSQLTRLGFLLDVVAPNFAAKVVEWQTRWKNRKS